jgi:hypothetical protein
VFSPNVRFRFPPCAAVNKDLIQISWNFVNDSLRTEVCLNYDPRLIAGAALYLSVKCLGFNITRNGAPATLFEVINMPKALIEGTPSRPLLLRLLLRLISGMCAEVSSQILDLYETAPSLASMRGDGSGSGASTGSTHMPAEDGYRPPPPSLLQPSLRDVAATTHHSPLFIVALAARRSECKAHLVHSR